jgi:hypothetical protein
MGRLDQPLNTFWQLARRSSGSSRWQVVTPPGVADNGGLVSAFPVPGAALAGFLPSQDLRFSPLAGTTDGGRDWSPLFLPGALVAGPDALAAGPGGARLALVRSGGGRALLAAAGGRWRTLPRLGAPGCAGARPGAAGFTPSGSPEVAARCPGAGTSALFVLDHGRWAASGPRLAGPDPGGGAAVLRLSTGAGGTAVLVRTGAGRAARLVARWSTGGAWAASGPLALGRAPVRATTPLGGGGWLVLRAGPAGPEADLLAAPGAAWHPLAAPPPDTRVLAPGPGGAVDALAGRGSVLTVWQAVPGSGGAPGSWAVSQRIRVPLAYGSSG